jgi:hypothetical protein
MSLARHHGINPKTVAKWRKRASVQDAPMGPKKACSTTLTLEQEAMIVAFRKHTLLPLDDCLCTLQETSPGSPARRCTAVFNATASAACPGPAGPRLQKRSSRLTP